MKTHDLFTAVAVSASLMAGEFAWNTGLIGPAPEAPPTYEELKEERDLTGMTCYKEIFQISGGTSLAVLEERLNSYDWEAEAVEEVTDWYKERTAEWKSVNCPDPVDDRSV